MGTRRTYAQPQRRRFLGLAGLAGLATIATSFALPVLPATAAKANASPTMIVVEKTAWGPILALGTGWTVYRLTSDKPDKSNCSGACLKAWPPVMLAKGQKAPLGKGVTHLGSFARQGGGRQVTYEGIPLYLFIGDKKAGDINGNIQDVYGQWWVVNPAHPKATPVKAGSKGTTTTVPGGGIAY